MKPPDILIVLGTAVVANTGRLFPGDGWTTADQVAVQMRTFGFAVRSQQCAAYLGRISRSDFPPVEAHEWDDQRELMYRVTGNGRLWLANRLPGIEVQG
jgi:hypothetical protein